MDIISTKDPFIQAIESFFTSYGFVRQESKFLREVMHQEPGQTVIINGQRYHQPGPQRMITFECELFGQGYVDHMDERPKDLFELIGFVIILEGNPVGHYCEGFYYDDIERFKMIAKQIFNLV